jgi:GT2 family glycosyltransferase
VSDQPARTGVVIVNFKCYPELRACLASLLTPDCAAPVVVVDHESDDGERTRVACEFPAARIIGEPGNHGFAAGVNRGARELGGDYLLLLNPDSLVVPGSVAAMERWLDEHPGVAIAGPRIRDIDQTVQASARRFPDFTTAIAGRSSWLTRVWPRNPLSRRNLPYSLDAISEPQDVDWVSGACMIVRRTAFDALRGLDEGFFLYWEDADFCRRAILAGWRVVYLPIEGTVHTGGASSRHATDAALTAFHRSVYRLFTKHAPPATRTLAPLVWVALQLRLALMRRLVGRRSST